VNLTQTMCYRCGKEHSPDTCRFKESLYWKCSKKGHIAKVCRSEQSDSKRQRNTNAQAHGVNQVEPTKPRSEQQDLVYNLFNINNNQQSTKPVQVTVVVSGQSLLLEVDTGSALSLISENAYLSLWTDNDRPPLTAH